MVRAFLRVASMTRPQRTAAPARTASASSSDDPVDTFVAYLEGGYSLDEFLRGYPTVSRQQAVAVQAWMLRHGSAALKLDRAS